MKEQHKLDAWSLVEGFDNTQNQPIRTQQVSYIREFLSFIRSKEGIFWCSHPMVMKMMLYALPGRPEFEGTT